PATGVVDAATRAILDGAVTVRARDGEPPLPSNGRAIAPRASASVAKTSALVPPPRANAATLRSPVTLTTAPPLPGPATPTTPSSGPASTSPETAAATSGRDAVFTVHGTVRQPDGSVLPDAIVQAFDRDLRHEQALGQAITDTAGHYLIRYLAAQFRR